MSKIQTYLILILLITISGCQKTLKESKFDIYFKNKLLQQKLSDDFEEDSEYGYIKIGKFLNSRDNNAIVISFDSIRTFSIYELNNNDWIKIYNHKNVDFSRVNEITAYIEDYNFDGINDIGIKNEISNGTSIMTFRLWLSNSNNKSFKYIPEFKKIGNPVIVKSKKIIHGFKACCAFTEMIISDYKWDKFKLVKTHTLSIENYPNSKEAISKNELNKIENKIKLADKDISKIINFYSENWILLDTRTSRTHKRF